jgi:hypothetical protein
MGEAFVSKVWPAVKYIRPFIDANVKIRLVDAEKHIAVCEAVAHGFADFTGVCEFIFDKPSKKISAGDKTHVSRALSSARELGMLSFEGEVKSASLRLANGDGADPRVWTLDEQKLFFRERLQAFQPFLRYFDFVTHGFSHASAAAKVSSLLKVDPPVTGENNVLRKWGEYSGVFGVTGNVLPAAATADVVRHSKFVESALQGLDDELKARTFLQEWLGEEVFKAIHEDIRGDLVYALTKYQTDPEGSINKLGNALEDQLKDLARRRGVKLEDSKGKPLHMIGQMIQLLRSSGVLADHHATSLRGLEVFVAANVLNGFNAFRKMKAHGKNLDAQQRWNLSPEIALVVALQTILTIRSTYFYVVKNKLNY